MCFIRYDRSMLWLCIFSIGGKPLLYIYTIIIMDMVIDMVCISSNSGRTNINLQSIRHSYSSCTAYNYGQGNFIKLTFSI